MSNLLSSICNLTCDQAVGFSRRQGSSLCNLTFSTQRFDTCSHVFVGTQARSQKEEGSRRPGVDSWNFYARHSRPSAEQWCHVPDNTGFLSIRIHTTWDDVVSFSTSVAIPASSGRRRGGGVQEAAGAPSFWHLTQVDTPPSHGLGWKEMGRSNVGSFWGSKKCVCFAKASQCYAQHLWLRVCCPGGQSLAKYIICQRLFGQCKIMCKRHEPAESVPFSETHGCVIFRKSLTLSQGFAILKFIWITCITGGVYS